MLEPSPGARFLRGGALVASVVAPLFALVCASCGDRKDAKPPALSPPQEDAAERIVREARAGKPRDPAELLPVWNRGVMELDQHRFLDAIKTFGQLVEAMPDAADAWVNFGIASMNGVTPELFAKAEDAFRRALKLAPAHLHAHHAYGVLLKHLGRPDESERHFRAVLERDPNDPAANYYLGSLLAQSGADEECEKHLRAAIAAEPHLSSAIHRLFQLANRAGKTEGRDALRDAFLELERSGTGDKAGIVYTEMGRYGAAVREFPLPLPPGAKPAAKLHFELAATLGEPRDNPLRPPGRPRGPASAEEQILRDKLEPFGPGAALADVDGDGDLDLYQADFASAGRLWRNDGGKFVDVTAEAGLGVAARSVSGCFGDVDNDGDPDLYVACAGPNHLFRNDGGRFTDVTAAAGVAGGDVFTAQAVLADLDSDGDVDIFCANAADMAAVARATDGNAWPAGAADQLFNNNRDGTFSDIAARCGVAGGPSASFGAIAGDLDGDHDADLLVLGGQGPCRVHRNDRIWRFAEVAREAGLDLAVAARGAIGADLDGDGLGDLLVFGGDGKGARAFRNHGRLRFTPDAAFPAAPEAVTGAAGDFDNDGDLDVVIAGAEASRVLLRSGDSWSAAPDIGALPTGPGLRTLLAADLDGDGVLDLVASRTGPAVQVFRGRLDPALPSVTIALKGVREEGKTRTNTGGIGAVVSATAGTLTQVREIVTASGVLGGPAPVAHFGLGAHAQADYIRVVWPDDVIQSEPNVSTGQRKLITQVNRKGSSCPLLFAWDGERFAFVTDFLGVGGLGFFVAPGVYAPPDPTERVAIPWAVPKDGGYELRIHEPMEEVCYLDQARLLAVDHPPGLEVWPDERLASGAPEQTGRLLVIATKAKLWPVALRTAEGDADVACVLEADRRYQPGVRPDKRFLGYAAPQVVELDFGDALRAADPSKPLFLFLDGWVEYPYSHVNFAAWQCGVKLQGLSLDCETAPGTWQEVLPDFGYPAGMPRTMTVDVSALPRTGTGRLRLRTNLELYVDRIFLAEDLGTAAIEVHDLAAERAELRTSGYPREFSPDGREPLLYDYALMDPAIDFKTLPGDYTRFGDVAALLHAADDETVVFGRAEEIVLRFPAPPAKEGAKRSLILDSAGWCKDMDLYTACPDSVDPLPFRAMSSFPYPPAEAASVAPKLDAYRRAWNTRRRSGR